MAYVPLDNPPQRTAQALDRASRSRLHIEPETAWALLALLDFHPDTPHHQQLRLALQAAARGCDWSAATQQAELTPRTALVELQHPLHLD